MTKKNRVEKGIEEIKRKIRDPEFQRKYKMSPKSFVRNRKMKFEDIMFFVLGLCATTLDCEREHFQTVANIETISTAAICKARDKISSEAFRELLRQTSEETEQLKRYNNYKILAVDGMRGELPNTPEMKKKYPGHKGNYPQFHAVIVYNALNNRFLDAEFLAAPTHEREACLKLLERRPVKDDEIYLFDRGYPSLQVIQKLDIQRRRYVMSLESSSFKEVNKFIESTETDRIIKMEYDKKGFKGNKKGVILPYSVEMRCVKIKLSEDVTEYLGTNLMSAEEFPCEEIGKLYGMRWQAETENNHLKNGMYVENFCSKKENSIKQEFYGRLVAYNLIEEIVEMAEEKDPYGKKY